MDGWVRGVVSSSDSFLLLFSTLPKALLFKTVVTTFLRPLYAVLYAACGVLLGAAIMRFEDLLHSLLQKIRGKFPAVSNLDPAASPGRVSKTLKWIWRTPSEVKKLLLTKNSVLDRATQLFLAICLSDTLRLLFHLKGFNTVAALGHEELSTWQLVTEPLCFLFLYRWCGQLSAKLGKTVWKKGISTSVAPLTKWRKKPMKDATEFLGYAWSRFMRSWGAYKKEAQDILNLLVEDVFNMVVVLRLLGLCFNLAPVVRKFLGALGLDSVLARHGDWVLEATGFSNVDNGRYLSDKLVSFGFSEVLVAVKAIEKPIEGNLLEALARPSNLKQLVWRFLVPFVFFALEVKWQRLLKAQKKKYEKTWKGTDWTDGQYADMQQEFGTFWNKVDKDTWNAPQLKVKKVS